MASRIAVVKKAQVGLFGDSKVTAQVNISEIADKTTWVMVLTPTMLKDILLQTNSNTTDDLCGKILVVDDSTLPPAFIKGIDVESLSKSG